MNEPKYFEFGSLFITELILKYPNLNSMALA